MRAPGMDGPVNILDLSIGENGKWAPELAVNELLVIAPPRSPGRLSTEPQYCNTQEILGIRAPFEESRCCQKNTLGRSKLNLWVPQKCGFLAFSLPFSIDPGPQDSRLTINLANDLGSRYFIR
jgi:hypothetical protein